MPIGLAVTAIVTLFCSFLILHVGRDTKIWRLWWMDLLGVMDASTSREVRKSQEGAMARLCYGIFFLLLLTSLSCIYWTVDQVREYKREKTRFERELFLTRQEMDVVRSKSHQE